MIRFNLINVIDVEATCYPDRIFPQGETQEIIEVGIAVVDMRTRKIVDNHSLPIKPMFSKVSPFCTELTGWTQEELDRIGTTYAEAQAILTGNFDSKNRPWISQGNTDKYFFEKEAKLTGVPYPFGAEHMNIAFLTSLLTGRSKQLGLKKALRLFGLEMQGPHHRAKSDAYNSACQLLEIVERASFKI